MSNWQNVDEFDGESLKASELVKGEAIEGTIAKIQPSSNYEGAFFLTLDTAEGATRIFTSGNLSYKIKDGKLKPGYTVRITRLEDTPSKKKGQKPRTTFEVLVDTASKEVTDKGAPAV